MYRTFIVFAVLLLSVPSHAEIKTMTIRGIMGVGTSDSGLGGLNPDCAFATNSDIAGRVFSVCDFGDECEITGEIDTDRYNKLVTVSSVRIIDTIKEPSVHIIRDSAYWALAVQDEVYTGSLWVEPLTISDFKPYQKNGELWFEFNFSLIGHKKGPHANEEIGNGQVRLVRRLGKWHYYK